MEARLQFGPGNSAGFTPAGIAAFNDLRPAAVVRELVQNALDAAQEADQNTAVVCFRLSMMATDDIPDIDAYKAAFDAAVKTQTDMGNGHLPAKAKSVVRTIRRTLKKDEQRVLSVFDNGIGLDERRMNALLSDGVSAKSGRASGTYGNGHSVAIPASDLRYLLYGGVLETGATIGSGHAVLASHAPVWASSQHLCSGDGFLVRKFLNGRDGKLFSCASDNDIPEIILNQLSDISENTQHGSVIIIPAFNNFRESRRSLWEMVAEATACNFFQAVAEDRLVVRVEDTTGGGGTDTQVLNGRNIATVLANSQDKLRSRAFISGQKAYDAHATLTHGTSHSPVKTSYGSLQIRLLQKASGTPRIDLCRNGMWITDDKNIPGFYYKFRDRRPFHALLLLDSDGSELYRLVREAEGPLHDKLHVKDLDDDDRRAIKRAFAEVRKWLLAHTEEISDSPFTSDDYLTLNFGDGDDPFWGTPVAVGQRAPERTPVRTTSHRRKHSGRQDRLDLSGRGRRRTVKPFFHAVSVPISRTRRKVQVTCHRNCERAELRISVDENIDPTCDRVSRDATAEVELHDVLIDGRPADQSELMTRDKEVVGVRLGDLVEGQQVLVEADYTVQDYFDVIQASNACLRVEVTPGRKEDGS